MRYESFSFGSIRIDRVAHKHDLVIDRGENRKRQKKAPQTLSGRLRPFAALGQRGSWDRNRTAVLLAIARA